MTKKKVTTKETKMNKIINKIKNFFKSIETKREDLIWYFFSQEAHEYPKIFFDKEIKNFWYEEDFENFLKEEIYKYEDEKTRPDFNKFKKFFFDESMLEVNEDMLEGDLNEEIEGVIRKKFINKLYNFCWNC